MPSCQKHYQNLFHGDGVTLGRWHCVAHSLRLGEEQQTTLPTINIPLQGSFTRYGPEGVMVLNTLTAGLSNTHDVWRTSHVEIGVDTGIYLLLTPARAEALLRSTSDRGADAPFTAHIRPIDGPTWMRWYQLVVELEKGVLGAAAAQDHIEHQLEALVAPAPLLAPAGLVQEVLFLLQTRRARTLEDLSAALQMSPFHLCRVFRRATGQTIHHYMDQLRLRHAAAALSQRGVDLATLSVELGFTSHSHFSYRFRQAFGVTPRAWRARL